MKEKKRGNSTTLLIVLCWIVYTCSYLGKLGYNGRNTMDNLPEVWQANTSKSKRNDDNERLYLVQERNLD